MDGVRLSLVSQGEGTVESGGRSPGLPNLEAMLSTFLGLPSLDTQFLFPDWLPKVLLQEHQGKRLHRTDPWLM